MALISLNEVTLAFGGPLIFDRLNLQLEKGERAALLGRNGTGKTTLMKVLSGEVRPRDGEVVYQKGIRTAFLPQEVPSDLSGTVFDIVLSGLGERIKILSDYHRVSHRLQTEYSDQLMRQLSNLQAEMDHTNGWEIHRQVEQVLSQMKLDPEKPFDELSGGQKRRTLLARALVLKPDVLLLDEPTNHLDIDTIDWLEGFLKDYEGTILFVTHDRVFMQRLATKIMELDRGKLLSWEHDYITFLERKQAVLDNETAERARFGKKLAAEEIWIRQGIKARRTRNQGRVRALEEMRNQKKAQRQVVGKVRIEAQAAERSGQLVVKAEHIGYGYGELCLIRDFSVRIMRGDKIGVIGPNGSGKTTLLRILTGLLEPKRGTVRLGTNLEIAYYDQLREQLDEEKTVIENVSGTGEKVTINGRSRHVLGYLQDFLFSPERARTPVKVLSGGERNRLFLARLFTRPFNLLVMDEPTNDLDVETLELVEELLAEYQGTLFLVSHDRAFLNNVVTSTVALEGGGAVYEYPGGYDDWLMLRRSKLGGEVKSPGKIETSDPEEVKPERRLTAKEKRELEKIPVQIEKLEAEQTQIYAAMAEPDFYQKGPEEISEIKLQLEAVTDKLAAMYQRWETLERLE